jgi:hypothetical protein
MSLVMMLRGPERWRLQFATVASLLPRDLSLRDLVTLALEAGFWLRPGGDHDGEAEGNLSAGGVFKGSCSHQAISQPSSISGMIVELTM